MRDHLVEPLDLEAVEWLRLAVALGHEFVRAHHSSPTADDYARQFNRGVAGVPEEHAATCYAEIDQFFRSKRLAELSADIFRALGLRWGNGQRKLRTIPEVMVASGCSLQELIEGERALLRRLGFIVKRGSETQKGWAKL